MIIDHNHNGNDGSATTGRRRNAYLEKNPDTQPIISLGIGDTTVPVPEHILGGLKEGAEQGGKSDVSRRLQALLHQRPRRPAAVRCFDAEGPQSRYRS